MENRIEINGIWYVREDAITDPLDHLEAEEIELTFSEECCFESREYCFVASRTKKDNCEEFYVDIYVKFTDKRSGNKDTWKEDYWDNNLWLRGILENNPESINSFNEDTDLCEQGKKQFKAFLFRLKKEGWLV